MVELPGSKNIRAGVEHSDTELARAIDLMLAESPKDVTGLVLRDSMYLEFHEDEWKRMAAALRRPRPEGGELVERTAITMAVGNNGGTWATHYTDAQKDLWRSRAREVIAQVFEALTTPEH